MTERTAEEWGRIAVSLPGWRWWWEHDKRRPYGLPGYCRRLGRGPWVWVPDVSECSMVDDVVPDPDDPATEGCLIRLLGPVHEAVWYTGDCDRWVVAVGEERRLYTSLGRACIAAAEALGRWPAGE